MNRNELLIRRRIVFSGQVQGVGFRWRARQAAQLYGCTGWCRNNMNGSVVMEIQGKETAIDKVLQSLEAGRFVWIQNMDVTPLYVEPDERGFRTE